MKTQTNINAQAAIARFSILPLAYFLCSGALALFSGCSHDMAGATAEMSAATENSCVFKTDSTSYFEMEAIEDGVTINRVTTLRGDSLVSVNTYKDAPYTFLAAECFDMEGDEVKCEGDKITVISRGSPEELALSFGLNMKMERSSCLVVELSAVNVGDSQERENG